MEIACFGLMLLSAIFALTSSYNFSYVVIGAYRRQKILLNAGEISEINSFLRLTMACHKAFGWISSRAIKVPYFKELSENITTILLIKGQRVCLETSASLIVGFVLFFGLLSVFFTGSIVFSICAIVLIIVILSTFSNNRLEKDAHEIREMVPDALRSMGACAASGFSLMQTLEQTSSECKGALKMVFSTSANRLKMGETTANALSLLESLHEVPELKFVSIALQVQHISGGSIAPVLEAARISVLDEIELLRTLRIQTVQARMSASIVTIMPFLLLALFSFMSPDFLSPFFASPIGIVVLVVALSMQGLGVWSVRKILKDK